MFRLDRLTMPKGLSEDEQYEFVNKMRMRITIRGLACLYLAWLDFDIIRSYMRGTSDIPFVAFVLIAVIFTAVVVVVGSYTYRQWGDLKVLREELARKQQEKNAAAYLAEDGGAWDDDDGDDESGVAGYDGDDESDGTGCDVDGEGSDGGEGGT